MHDHTHIGALTRRRFLDLVGDGTVLWIAPDRVSQHFGSKWPVAHARMERLGRYLPKPAVDLLRPAIKRREPLRIPRVRFGKTSPVDDSIRYRKIADFVERQNYLKETLWFRDLRNELNRTGRATHKDIVMRTEDDILGFLQNYVLALIVSLRDEGFLPDHDGFASSAVIDAQGRICKSGSGNHRFNIARALRLPRFPLRIVGIHEDWARETRGFAPVTVGALIEDLQAVAAAHQAAPDDGKASGQ